MRLPRHPRPRVLARAIDPAALLGEAAASAIVPVLLVTLVDGVDVAILVGGFVGGHPAPSPSGRAAAAVAGARPVVFAATASASGDPNAVDHLGAPRPRARASPQGSRASSSSPAPASPDARPTRTDS